MIEKIVSGGQTGVDRAALDVAEEIGIPRGGWCPHGRAAEDGPIPARYPLQETPSADTSQRTEWNVRDSDGTLILVSGPLGGGTALTREMAQRYHKPCLAVDLDKPPGTEVVQGWIAAQGICTLNVAGPRESESPGIYDRAENVLREVLSRSGT